MKSLFQTFKSFSTKKGQQDVILGMTALLFIAVLALVNAVGTLMQQAKD